MKPISVLGIILLLFLYLRMGIAHYNVIVVSKRISARRKTFHIVMIWILPFIWYWFIKDFLKDSGTMTKSKRNISKGNYYESGAGMSGE